MIIVEGKPLPRPKQIITISHDLYTLLIKIKSLCGRITAIKVLRIAHPECKLDEALEFINTLGPYQG